MNKRKTAKNFSREIRLKENGQCPICEEKIKENSFKDELSIKEFKISGMCQSCQDRFFEGD